MNDKEQLKKYIDEAYYPTLSEWVYNVESFLGKTDNMDAEFAKLIKTIKFFGPSEKLNSTNLLSKLKVLYKDKYNNIQIPSVPKENKIFIAMCFNEDLKEYYNEGYKKIANDLGYKAVRIDEKEYTGSIIKEILNEISNSNILIADFTKNRGGVYYEAGIARGLNMCNHPIKLIFACQKTFFDTEGVHFDISGDNILLYDDADDLYDKLKKRLNSILLGENVNE